MSQSTQQCLYDFAKMALINIFAHPYAMVCGLYCGDVDADKWVDAQIGHYIGIGTPFFFFFFFFYLSFSLVNCSCCCCCFCRCTFV
ncbi:mRNA cap guanine-N7 methyltransferase 2 [Glycine soja]|uniref:mRNA cap guanine-N7 methyltransferase 2 n=1 Tax=Glycine soja TaxID=3848 RepID=A0A0B2Q794_GLYSO|nr:mRNA cap guanine-N7 methyltransferase 2 [Glycine soja]